MKDEHLLFPDWPAPDNVRAFTTTRRGGVSMGPWESFNLGLSCGDDRDNVLANRHRLADRLPSEPLWMRQVHGRRVVGCETDHDLEEADARVTRTPGQALVVLTADCLPVFLCDERGEVAAIAHAGWRGLADGVIEATVGRMNRPPQRLMAWLGPAIGGEVYEVGSEVRDAFAASSTLARLCVERAFAQAGNRWRLDIAGAGRVILQALGVDRVYGGEHCTYSDIERFFSHRRDGVTGRMASLIWLE